MSTPHHARRGAGEHHVDAGGLAELGAHHAAVRFRHQRFRRNAALFQGVLQRTQIFCHPGVDIAVDDGGRGAFVFPDHRPDLIRGEDEELRRRLADDFGHCRLVRRIAPAMQQRDDDPLGTQLLCRHDRGLYAGRIQRGLDRAVGAHALGDAEDPVAGDQRFRPHREEAVRFGHPKPGHFQYIGEILGGEEGHARPLPLDHRVDADRGAVDEAFDLRRLDAVIRGQACHPLHYLSPRLGRRRQHLQGRERLRLGIEDAEIDKGAADIDADAIGHGG